MLYPNDPIMAHCRQAGWQFMIVLPNKCLPSLWQEVEALKPRLPHQRYLQIEKRQGYCYEHAFSHTWQAMKGYHYLMRLAHLINALALASKRVVEQVRRLGVQAFLRWVRETCANRWLTRDWIGQFRAQTMQLRLE